MMNQIIFLKLHILILFLFCLCPSPSFSSRRVQVPVVLRTQGSYLFALYLNIEGWGQNNWTGARNNLMSWNSNFYLQSFLLYRWLISFRFPIRLLNFSFKTRPQSECFSLYKIHSFPGFNAFINQELPNSTCGYTLSQTRFSRILKIESVENLPGRF